MDASEIEVNFLDTTVYVEDNLLKTNLYCKSTDSHNYLLYSSVHPQKCKDSIPYEHFLRVCRICTKFEHFDKQVVKLVEYFLRRNYPLTLIEEAAIKARRLNREDLLKTPKKKQEKGGDKNILVSTYHPHDSTLPEIINTNWDLLGRSLKTNFLHTNRPMMAFRRPPNLRDLLVRADISTQPRNSTAVGSTNKETPSNNKPVPPEKDLIQTSITTFFKRDTQATCGTTSKNLDLEKPKPLVARKRNFCSKPKCRTCPLIDKSGKIECYHTGEIFH
jgi:hypothetical protein